MIKKEKRCTGCNEIKKGKDFYVFKKSGREYLQAKCKICYGKDLSKRIKDRDLRKYPVEFLIGEC